MQWETKTICAFIAMQAQLEEEGRKQIFDLAQGISIEPPEEDPELEQRRGEKVADRPQDDPRLQQHGENAPGSFEKFMGMFGPGGAARR